MPFGGTTTRPGPPPPHPATILGAFHSSPAQPSRVTRRGVSPQRVPRPVSGLLEVLVVDRGVPGTAPRPAAGSERPLGGVTRMDHAGRAERAVGVRRAVGRIHRTTARDVRV